MFHPDDSRYSGYSSDSSDSSDSVPPLVAKLRETKRDLEEVKEKQRVLRAREVELDRAIEAMHREIGAGFIGELRQRLAPLFAPGSTLRQRLALVGTLAKHFSGKEGADKVVDLLRFLHYFFVAQMLLLNRVNEFLLENNLDDLSADQAFDESQRVALSQRCRDFSERLDQSVKGLYETYLGRLNYRRTIVDLWDRVESCSLQPLRDALRNDGDIDFFNAESLLTPEPEESVLSALFDLESSFGRDSCKPAEVLNSVNALKRLLNGLTLVEEPDLQPESAAAYRP